jgi:hypothetical protein
VRHGQCDRGGPSARCDQIVRAPTPSTAIRGP